MKVMATSKLLIHRRVVYYVQPIRDVGEGEAATPHGSTHKLMWQFDNRFPAVILLFWKYFYLHLQDPNYLCNVEEKLCLQIT